MELSDIFNIIGILLEIGGFVILLNQVRGWFQKREKHRLDKITKEYMNTANNELPTPDLRKAQKNYIDQIHLKRFETSGIILVIVGLIFQLLSNLKDNMLI
jgi:hypothetical protein